MKCGAMFSGAKCRREPGHDGMHETWFMGARYAWPAAPAPADAQGEALPTLAPSESFFQCGECGAYVRSRDLATPCPSCAAIAAAEARGRETERRDVVAWLEKQRDNAWGVARRDADRGRYDLANKYWAEGSAHGAVATCIANGAHRPTPGAAKGGTDGE